MQRDETDDEADHETEDAKDDLPSCHDASIESLWPAM